MAPSTALVAVAVAVASMVRGGARNALPPPSRPEKGPRPEKGISLKEPYDAFMKSLKEPYDASRKTYDAFMKINEPLRFFISGNCGNVVFFYLDRLAFSMLQKIENLPATMKDYMDSMSFFIAYILQVVPQHWFHALLVYGLHSIDTRKKYFTTLIGCYSAYMGSLVGSTLLNTLFVKILKMNKNIAFITTLWTFAAINYFVIGWIVRRADEWEAPKIVVDARKAAKDAQRAVAESKKKEQVKAKMIEAKMKAKAEQAKLKAKALEDRVKAKSELDKQKAKEQALKEKERAKERVEKLKIEAEKERARAKAEKLKQEALKKTTTTNVKEVGNKAAKNSASKTIKKARGGSVRLSASLDSKELLHSFVLSVGDAVNVL